MKIKFEVDLDNHDDVRAAIEVLLKFPISKTADQELISDLPIRKAGALSLKNEGIETLVQLSKYTEMQILKTPNVGRKDLNTLKDRMTVYGIKFAELENEQSRKEASKAPKGID